MVDEAEAVLMALHRLRPHMRLFEIFNAWTMIKRGRYQDTSYVLRSFDAVPEMRLMPTSTPT